MERFLRSSLITAAFLVTILDFFSLEEYSRSPYNGILHSNLVFLEFERESPNQGSGLVRGDRITAVDGIPVRNINHYKYLTSSNYGLVPQLFTVKRDGAELKVPVLSVNQPRSKILQKTALSLTALTFIMVGFWVILKRPDILGRLFTANCFIISFFLTERPVTPYPVFHILGELMYDGMFAFLPAFFLHFFIIFPGKDIGFDTRRSRISRVLYILPTLIFLAFFALALVNYSREVRAEIINAANGIASIYWVLYMTAGVALFIRTYMTSDRVQRMKFRIATIGLVVGIAPGLVVMLARQFIPSIEIPHAYLSMVFLSITSVSFAYAILKHDAFDMRIVFKAGLAYVILPLILAGLVYAFVNWMGNRFPGLSGIGYYPLIAISIAAILLLFITAKAGIQRLVDWTFNKDRMVFGERLVEFTRKIQFMRSYDEISALVARELHDIFGADYAHIYLGDSAAGYTIRDRYPADTYITLTSFPPGIELIKLAVDKRRPLMPEYFDRLWMKNNLDRISLELLSMSRASAVIPLIEQNELLGFILLGKKRSGKPYTKSDADMMELIAERSSAAFRHNMLYRVSIEKERLEKEVHLASKIQRRLLPESPPDLRSATIIGRLENSREIGGDFYDYVQFSESSVGIAVADVSGKGIPASLLMTTLQASFRAEAAMGRSPGEVLASLNRSLYQRSEESKFATFFYAIYDDTKSLLHFSNAGAYPPVVIHDDGRTMLLKRGGILVGVEPDTSYSEGIIKLRPGDLVAIYTDGIIDQENPRKEYFGGERLMRFLKENHASPPQILLDRLYETLMSFGEGIIKDDMTMVFIKKHPG